MNKQLQLCVRVLHTAFNISFGILFDVSLPQRINRPLCKAVSPVSMCCPSMDSVDSCTAESCWRTCKFWSLCLMHSLLLSDFKQNVNDSTICVKLCDSVANILWALEFLPPLNGWTYRTFATDYPQCSDRVCKEYGNVKPVCNKLW